ncbi:MFS transporter [Luedemannella helvata]|uniref:MFS transporter n=1 Tax=Luedemannella helvata TaxID=349315 RepID=UPI0031CE2ED7
MPPALTVLTRNPDFRRLFLAELVMFGGDWFALIPLMTLLQELTGSGLPSALALVADTAVNALMLPFAGVVADRVNRRAILIAANLAAIGAISLLFLVRTPDVAWLGPVAIGLAATAKAFYTPAAGAALPNLVSREDLGTANALAGSAWGTMLVVGASAGGVVSARVGPYTCFLITVVSLAVAAVLVWRVRRPMQQPREAGAEPPRPWHALREAVRYIVHRPQVASLVTVKSAVGIGNGVLGAFPLLATTVFGVGSMGLGALFAARGLGALLGPLMLRRALSRRRWLLPGLAISMAAYGLAYVGVAVAPWFWLAFVLVALAHFGGGGNWAMSNYALQLVVPDALRGRVMAADMTLATLAISVSVLVAGLFVDSVSPRVVVAACGAATLLYAVVWRVMTRRLSPVPVEGDLVPGAAG